MIPDKVTIGAKYGPAMEVRTKEAAQTMFEDLVEHTMRVHKLDRQAAEAQERSNLGYYAGYYDRETRERVENLFGGIHPVFGSVHGPSLTPEEAFRKGFEHGKAQR